MKTTHARAASGNFLGVLLLLSLFGTLFQFVSFDALAVLTASIETQCLHFAHSLSCATICQP